jgi:hypothetical protein
MAATVISYQKVVEELGSGRSHLLLGNGFSISCDACFHYGSLFEYAKTNGLTTRVLDVFERMGTNNFEGVMRLLEDSDWIASHYGLVPPGPTGSRPLQEDLESVKSALLKAVASTHPEHTHKVADGKKAACAGFLAPYHNIFTTNYDLLLYWVEMSALLALEGRDGFRQRIEGSGDKYVIFSEHVGRDKGIFFLHGALHLYVVNGEVRKHTWSRTQRTLIDNIKESLDLGRYPLFVAEGKPEKKLEQIQRSGYLSYCIGKLERIENALVVFGFSFCESDGHFCDVIARNKELTKMFVGLFGPSDNPANLEIQKNVKQIQDRREALITAGRSRKSLEVVFYDSATAPVWKSL